jgi:acyl phosphate:glycerol-3-phosphate acyltransferase
MSGVVALAALSGAYLVGSIPSGFLVARAWGVTDIRQHGSGNIGATNVARVLGKKLFCLVLLLDVGKAYAYLALLSFFGIAHGVVCYAALGLLLGNSASLFLRFSGGKGVATTVGALAYVAPVSVGVALAIWLVVLALVRTVGIASVAAAMSIILVAVLSGFKSYDPCALTSGVMAVWVVFLHKKNITKFLSI